MVSILCLFGCFTRFLAQQPAIGPNRAASPEILPLNDYKVIGHIAWKTEWG